MNISPQDLGAQYDRASKQWPFIKDAEVFFGLPSMLLFAIGSRETNLTDVVGDGGHGWGVFQRDNRSHFIPANYLNDVRQQAIDAAVLLVSNYHRWGSWQGACAAYNSGQPNDAYTTGHDYGADVIGRMAWLEKNRAVVQAPQQGSPRLLRLATPPMTGNDVAFWQGALWDRKWVPWPTPASKYTKGRDQWTDGVFGKDMDMSVRWAQQHVGVVPDGVLGPQTIRAWQMWKGK